MECQLFLAFDPLPIQQNPDRKLVFGRILAKANNFFANVSVVPFGDAMFQQTNSNICRRNRKLSKLFGTIGDFLFPREYMREPRKPLTLASALRFLLLFGVDGTLDPFFDSAAGGTAASDGDVDNGSVSPIFVGLSFMN